MGHKALLLFACVALLVSVTFGSAVADNAEPSDAERAADSRDVVKSFAARLKGELMRAVQDGGPETAIAVCQTVAPEIAEDNARETGWSVGRTALRLRNPANAPDAWEREVLLAFQSKIEEGATAGTLEHYEKTVQDGKAVFRYMKAIPTQGPCLACHGPNVSASVMERIAEFYPEDQAVGFLTGDLRGAFTIVQPLE